MNSDQEKSITMTFYRIEEAQIGRLKRNKLIIHWPHRVWSPVNILKKIIQQLRIYSESVIKPFNSLMVKFKPCPPKTRTLQIIKKN